jgi:RNA exonuclease 4
MTTQLQWVNETQSPAQAQKDTATDKPDLTLAEKSLHVTWTMKWSELAGPGAHDHLALAHVCIINWSDKKFVKNLVLVPKGDVTDYLIIIVSGILHQNLEFNGVLHVEKCHSCHMLELLEERILVGHALKNNLHALSITHPWYDTRNTAKKYKPFMKIHYYDGILWPGKLKELFKKDNIEIMDIINHGLSYF